MLDAFIIDEIRRQEEARKRKEEEARPRLRYEKGPSSQEADEESEADDDTVRIDISEPTLRIRP